jgi:glycosyltransferase involved in cell wall biosynthesis
MNDITALVLTYNEQENISRVLDSISWIPKIIVADSNSTDETVKLASNFPNVTLVQRAFDSFANQCNFGLSQIHTEWVLSLDADYVVTPELREQIRTLDPNSSVAGYSVDFRYCIFGQPLRASLYPSRTALYRRKLAQYRDEGHGHRVTVDGKIEKLLGKIDHDDRKPLSRWIESQDRYARLEASYLLNVDSGLSVNGHQLSGGPRPLKPQDRLRLAIYFAPIVMFFYLLFGRGLILDGWRGWYYVAQRVIAELLLSIRLLEAKMHGARSTEQEAGSAKS